jgi:hypothetical protein
MTAGVELHLSYLELIVVAFLLVFGLLRELMHLIRGMGDELLHFLEWWVIFHRRARGLWLAAGAKQLSTPPAVGQRHFVPDVGLDHDRLPSKTG